jgi:hydroxypyruvate reductase
MPIDILMIAPMSSVERGLKNYTVHHLPPADARPAFLKSMAARIRGIVTYSGGGVVDQALLDELPEVEIITNMGVGYDSVDMTAARARNIIVTNAGSSNAIDVGEHAIGLMLDVGRKISFGDRYVRAGEWAKTGRIKVTHRVSGKKLGIVGLGNIGLEIAKRAAAFDMPIAYHNRKPRTNVPYRYVESVVTLAEESDILICATPGGDETRHLISGAVIGALGPDGIFVNIGRGTTVDEAALVTALSSGALGGAGLDVFENEPRVPEVLLSLPNVVLQPHVGGATYEGIAAAVDTLVLNFDLHFAGKPVLTPV